MSTAPLARERTAGQRLARTALGLFLVAWFGSSLLRRQWPILTDVLALAVALAGMVLAGLALARVGREGRKGILVPATIGILLHGLLIVIWLSNFLGHRPPAT